MDTINKVLDWLKLSPKYLFAISLATGIALFSPSNFLAAIGIDSIVDQYKPYIGGTFLISTAIFLAYPLADLYGLARDRITTAIVVKNDKKRLHDLTDEEKIILRNYIFQKTKTQYLDPRDGVVNELKRKRIIYAAASVGKLYGVAYNIQPWAWNYLNEHASLLLSEDEILSIGKELDAQRTNQNPAA